jgi:hypothetical protein
MTAGKQLDSSAAGVKTAGVRRQKKNWSVGVTEHWNSIKQANIPLYAYPEYSSCSPILWDWLL